MLNLKSLISYIDLKLLLWPILTFIIVMAGSLLLYSSVTKTKADTKSRIDEGELQLTNIRTQIAEIAQEELTVVRYIDQYLYIDQSGAFKKEDRLALLQMLDSLRTKLGLNPISVSIDNQRRTDTTLKYPQSITGMPLYLSGSRLTIRIPLAHEDYLMTFLQEFHRSQSLSVLESCILEVAGPSTFSDINFYADCAINWVTFDFDTASQEPGNATASIPLF